MSVPKYSVTAADPFAGLLGYHLRRASVLVMADLTAALEPLGLTPTAASVLFIIAAGGGVTQAEIGRALGIQRANMAPIIGHLIRQDLLEREAVDGRSQALRLSRAGQATHRKAMQTTLAHEQRLFGNFTAAERERMIAQLRVVWESEGK
jgi:DNA-binding MarR family transcriptional regulator